MEPGLGAGSALEIRSPSSFSFLGKAPLGGGVFQLLNCVQLFAAAWTSARQASLSITNSQSLLKLMSIKSVMPSNNLILFKPPLLPSIFSSIWSFPMSWPFALGGQSIG